MREEKADLIIDGEFCRLMIGVVLLVIAGTVGGIIGYSLCAFMHGVARIVS